MIILWRHESNRTFVDKLTNYTDKKIFGDLLDRVTKDKFGDSSGLGFEDEQLLQDYLFADFQRDDILDEAGDVEEEAPFVYEACPDLDTIRDRCNKRLEDYNEKN